MPTATGKKSKDLDPKSRGKKVKGGHWEDNLERDWDRIRHRDLPRARKNVRRDVKNVRRVVRGVADMI